MTNFYVASSDDKRIAYASEYLQNYGCTEVTSLSNADFVIAGVNPKNLDDYKNYLVFAGNVNGNNVFDYTKDEIFAAENAFYTAEAAVSLAIQNSDLSLVDSKILLVGYGRIAKALHKFLSAFSSNITVCARSEIQRTSAKMNGAKTVTFGDFSNKNNYDFVFNTVPHPVLNERELRSFKQNVLIIDLASFPGGADVHFAKSLGLNLIVARGLPGKISPKSAGRAVAKTVIAHTGVML